MHYNDELERILDLLQAVLDAQRDLIERKTRSSNDLLQSLILAEHRLRDAARQLGWRGGDD